MFSCAKNKGSKKASAADVKPGTRALLNQFCFCVVANIAGIVEPLDCSSCGTPRNTFLRDASAQNTQRTINMSLPIAVSTAFLQTPESKRYEMLSALSEFESRTRAQPRDAQGRDHVPPCFRVRTCTEGASLALVEASALQAVLDASPPPALTLFLCGQATAAAFLHAAWFQSQVVLPAHKHEALKDQAREERSMPLISVVQFFSVSEDGHLGSSMGLALADVVRLFSSEVARREFFKQNRARFTVNRVLQDGPLAAAMQFVREWKRARGVRARGAHGEGRGRSAPHVAGLAARSGVGSSRRQRRAGRTVRAQQPRVVDAAKVPALLRCEQPQHVVHSVRTPERSTAGESRGL